MSVEAIDPDGQRFIAPIDIADRLDHVLSGLLFLIGCYGVFQIQKNDIRIRCGSFFEKFWRASRYSQFGALQTGRALFNEMKAQQLSP